MRLILILILAVLAGQTIITGPNPAPAAPEMVANAGLVVVVDAQSGVRAAGQMPPDFPVGNLRKRIPEVDLSGGVESLAPDAFAVAV